MKYIKLQNSNDMAMVDDEDYDRLSKFKWYYSGGKRGVYRRKNVAMADDIMQNYKLIFDHIDRNVLNGQKSNLRKCDCSQNSCNRRKRAGSSSIFIGVGWHKHRSKWKTSVTKEGIHYSIGYFDDEVEAAVARDKAAVQLHGEFAVLNTQLIVNRITSGMIPSNCSISI